MGQIFPSRANRDGCSDEVMHQRGAEFTIAPIYALTTYQDPSESVTVGGIWIFSSAAPSCDPFFMCVFASQKSQNWFSFMKLRSLNRPVRAH